MRSIKAMIMAMAACAVMTNAQAYDFTDNNDGTLLDNDTGLTWMANSASNRMTWEDAVVHCDSLELGGLSDWRLPTVEEMYTVANLSGNPLYLPVEFDEQWSYVWSSEGYDDFRVLSFSYYPYYYDTDPVATFDKTYPLACRCVHDGLEIALYELTINKTGYYTLDIVTGGGELIEVYVNDELVAIGYEGTSEDPMIVGNFVIGDVIYVTYDGMPADMSYIGDSIDSMYWEFDGASTVIHIIDPPMPVVCEEIVADTVVSVDTKKFKIETKHNETTVDMRLISPEFYGAEGETLVTVLLTLSNGRVIELNGSVDLSTKNNKNRSVWKK